LLNKSSNAAATSSVFLETGGCVGVSIEPPKSCDTLGVALDVVLVERVSSTTEVVLSSSDVADGFNHHSNTFFN